MADRVRIEIEDGVARIALDDGKVNAMSVEMMAEITAALEKAEAAGAVAVLTGRTGIFSAGFDLKTFQRGGGAGIEMVRIGAELILRLLAFPRPVVTVCTGHAYPMGAFLMLSADARFGLAGAFRIGMNETAIGLTLPKFAVELARHRLTPPGFARVATGALFGPEEALRLGYLDRVLPAEQLDAAVAEEVTRLRGLDMPAFAATKARLNEQVIHAVRTAVAAEMPRRD